MANEKSTPCYVCWFFTISLSIAAGTLLVDAIRAGIAYASFDKITNRIVSNTNRVGSSETKTPTPPKIDVPKKELPIVKLTPNNKIHEKEKPEDDIFIKVLPDKKTSKKDIPKEKMPGYQTTLQTCNFWKKEVEKEATSQNTAYMEAACNRLKSYE
jgi:hypothetical protein